MLEARAMRTPNNDPFSVGLGSDPIAVTRDRARMETTWQLSFIWPSRVIRVAVQIGSDIFTRWVREAEDWDMLE